MDKTIDSLDPARWVPAPLPAVRPALKWREWFARWWPARSTESAYRELAELDAHTLADIGAPDDLQACAMARREWHAQAQSGLHAGLTPGAWRHW